MNERILKNKVEKTKFEPVAPRILSRDEIKKVVFLSYMFSQGNVPAQIILLDLIKNYYGTQRKKSPRIIGVHIDRVRVKLTSKKTHSEVINDPDSLDDDVYAPFLCRKLSKSTFDTVATNIIFSDYDYLIKKDGRPNRYTENIGQNNLKDRYFSFFVHYILRQNKTGDEAFDWIILNVRKYFVKKSTTDVKKDRIQDIIKTYNLHHPQTPVTKDEFEKIGMKSLV